MEATCGKTSLRTVNADPDMGGLVWNHTLAFEVSDGESEVKIAVGTRTHVIRQHLNVKELGEMTMTVGDLPPHEEVRVLLRLVCVNDILMIDLSLRTEFGAVPEFVRNLMSTPLPRVCAIAVCLYFLSQVGEWYLLTDSKGGHSCVVQYLWLSFRWSFRSASFTGHVPEYRCV